MLKLFGGGAKDKAPNTQDAIQQLRETTEMLQKKSDFLEKKIDTEVAAAKKAGTKNKRVALQHLKRKKRYEKQLTDIDGTLSTVEFQLEALQNAQSNKQVLDSMKVGASALKKAHGNMSADQVHDMMDDISEQQEISQEINEALAGGMGAQFDVDEDDLMAELEELEQEELDENLLDVDVTHDELPDVPSQQLPSLSDKSKSKASTEDDELAQLEMWAN